jgi:hypothetical protein
MSTEPFLATRLSVFTAMLLVLMVWERNSLGEIGAKKKARAKRGAAGALAVFDTSSNLRFQELKFEISNRNLFE